MAPDFSFLSIQRHRSLLLRFNWCYLREIGLHFFFLIYHRVQPRHRVNPKFCREKRKEETLKRQMRELHLRTRGKTCRHKKKT